MPERDTSLRRPARCVGRFCEFNRARRVTVTQVGRQDAIALISETPRLAAATSRSVGEGEDEKGAPLGHVF